MRARLFRLPQQIIQQTQRSFHQSVIPPKQLRKDIGPDESRQFSTMAIIALFTNDLRYAPEDEFYNLMTHMVGKGLKGHELNPSTSSDHHSIEIPKAVNTQRSMYLSLLAKRFPGVLDMAQKLYWCKHDTLHKSPGNRHDQTSYFDRVEKVLNITIPAECRVLDKGELVPRRDHQVFEVIERHVKNMYGSHIFITPYTRAELDTDWPAMRARLPQNKHESIYDALMKFDAVAYAGESVANIAADVGSEQVRKLSL